MNQSKIDRRGLLRAGVGMAAIAGAATLPAPAARAQEKIAHSAATQAPTTKLPALACDSHMHFYHSRYPLTANVLRPSPDATIEEYRKLQARNGTVRTVVVTPSAYGTDNSASADGMAALGANARGVAVVVPSVADAELARLHALGFRGVRFNLATPGTTTIDMVPALAARLAPLGWHLQFHIRPEQIVASQALWPTLDIPVVFDHMGRIPRTGGTDHPAFKILSEGLARGKTWIKLSGAYMDTTSGPPGYADSVALAKAFVAIAPERMVWGSDWPHPTESVEHKPDDSRLVDLMGEVAPDAARLKLIFVDNPARLYDFPKAG
jgi:predicted TIM-barrel fold metal-dependent hydrolase